MTAYNPATQLYNWHPGNTRAWRRAVSRVWSGGTAARINCFGPSTVAGYTTGGRSEWHAWPSYLRRMMAQRYGESGTGTIYYMETDSRVNTYGAWTREPYGPFGRSCFATNTPGDNRLWFSPSRCTGYRVTYMSAPGAGRLTATSDATALTVDCNASYGVRSAALPAGSLGDHTLTITSAGGSIFVLAVEGYVGPTLSWTTGGVAVTNVGMGSTVVANLIASTNGIDTSLRAAVDVNAADLSIVAYAENSPGYQTPAQMKTDYRVLLDRIRASGSDILLCTSIDWQGEISDFKAPQAAYDAALYELADEYDVPLFDVAARWGRWEDSPSYYADRIHPAPMGYADIAAGLYSALHTGI